jgi:hypothetical protein
MPGKHSSWRFLSGQFNEPLLVDYDYEIMLTDVTVSQYVAYLNAAFSDGTLMVDGEQIVGFYPGDVFRGVKHEVEIPPGDYIIVPLNDPASRFGFDGSTFSAQPDYENHPMTNVSWFGAWGYCGYIISRLPSEVEWEKAARGTADERPFPWGDEIARNNANFYASRDPFEDMSSFGSGLPGGFIMGRLMMATRPLIRPARMACMTWLATSGSGLGMSMKGCITGSCAAARRIPMTWTCESGCATMQPPRISARMWDFAV